MSGYEKIDFCIIFNSIKKKVTFSDLFEEQEMEVSSLNIQVAQPNVDIVNEKDVLYNTFISALNYLNFFLDSYRTVNNAIYVKNVSIADLPPVIVMHSETADYLYVIEKNIFLQTDTSVDISSTIKYLSTYQHAPEILDVDRFFSSGKYYLYSEEYPKAVIELQTSFEIFIRNAHRLILQKNGANDTDIEKAMELPFRNAIEHHIANELGVNLDFNNNAVINKWFKNLYSLRNDIVHKGKYDIIVSGCDKMNKRGG